MSSWRWVAGVGEYIVEFFVDGVGGRGMGGVCDWWWWWWWLVIMG